MSKKRQANIRTVLVEFELGNYQKAVDEVKKVSGCDSVLPIRARKEGNAVEYEFLVAEEMSHCKAELMNMQLEAEGYSRG